MADATGGQDRSALRHRFLLQYEQDLLSQRPLRIRVVIEFAGTFLLVTAGSNYPISEQGGDQDRRRLRAATTRFLTGREPADSARPRVCRLVRPGTRIRWRTGRRDPS